ncbi:GP46-like surface antigen, putative, partial [Bodo saltans]
FGNALNGTIPSSAAQWTKVQSFDVGFNMLTGTLPPELGVWTDISFFSIASNSFVGTLSAEFSRWVQLETFFAPNNKLTGTLPPGCGMWSQLSLFSIAFNSFGGTLPMELRMWTLLRGFYIGSNSFVGTLAEGFRSWVRLEAFYASNNNLTGTLPASYISWTSMTEFSFEYNQLTGSLPAAYGRWTGITVFGVSGNTQLSSTLPSAYSAWVSLSTFDVSGARIHGTLPPEYSAWTQLGSLNVSHNQLTGSIPPEYGPSWINLVSLDVSSNQLAGTIPAALGHWTMLELFVVGNNSLSGTLPVEFSSWTGLVTFRVEQNAGIVGSLPPQFAQWLKLRIFYAHETGISGTLSAEHSSWTALRQFWLHSAHVTGTLPPQYRSWVKLQQFVLHSNSMTGTLPPEYSAWSDALFISVRNNHLQGSVPSSWAAGMRDLRNIHVASNSLNGTIPNTFGSLPYLTSISVSDNNFSGMLPTFHSSLISLVDIQHNSQLNATLPPQIQIWTTCDTQIPCSLSALPMQYCLPPNFDLTTLYTGGVDIPGVIGMIAPFRLNKCWEPPLPSHGPRGDPSMSSFVTKTLSLGAPQQQPPTLSSIFASYQPRIAPSAAFTVALSIADPVTGVGLAALGLGRCAPAALREATWYSQVLLSPFYHLGPGVSVLGNIGLCFVGFAMHCVAVNFLTKKKKCRHVTQDEKRSSRSSLELSTAVEVSLRFPGLSLAATLFLARGIAFYGGQSFIDDSDSSVSTSNGNDAIGLRIMNSILSMIFLIGLVGVVIWAERRGLTKPLKFERYRAAALTRLRWVPRWILPIGRWGPDDARRRLAAFRGPVAGGRENFAMLPAGVGIVGSLIVGAVPGTAGGCIAQAACQCLLLGGSVIAIGVLRPMRVPAAGWLLCSTLILQACINLCIVVGRTTDAESAIDAMMFLSAVYSVVGLLRVAHRIIVWYWERGINPKRDIFDEAKSNISPSSNLSPCNSACNTLNWHRSKQEVRSCSHLTNEGGERTATQSGPRRSAPDSEVQLNHLEKLLHIICMRSSDARSML